MSDEWLREQYILLLIEKLTLLQCCSDTWKHVADRLERCLALVPKGSQAP